MVMVLSLCAVALSQQNNTHGKSVEIISKTMKLESTQFIQIPGPNPLLTPAESGWDRMYNEAADIFKD